MTVKIIPPANWQCTSDAAWMKHKLNVCAIQIESDWHRLDDVESMHLWYDKWVFVMNDGGIINASSVDIYMTPHITHVGLIQDRHKIPVSTYLLPSNIAHQVGYHHGMYCAAKKAAQQYIKANGNCILYFTGLTTAAVGAIDGMRAAGITHPIVRNYDKLSGKYVEFSLNDEEEGK